MNKRIGSALTLLLAVMLAFGTLTLTACGGQNAAQEQDNCYGEDMPVINE